jgi:hypothetical protein
MYSKKYFGNLLLMKSNLEKKKHFPVNLETSRCGVRCIILFLVVSFLIVLITGIIAINVQEYYLFESISASTELADQTTFSTKAMKGNDVLYLTLIKNKKFVDYGFSFKFPFVVNVSVNNTSNSQKYSSVISCSYKEINCSKQFIFFCPNDSVTHVDIAFNQPSLLMSPQDPVSNSNLDLNNNINNEDAEYVFSQFIFDMRTDNYTYEKTFVLFIFYFFYYLINYFIIY